MIRLSWPDISSGKPLFAIPGETGLVAVSSRQRLTRRAIRSGHAYRGRTARNQSLFLGRGFAYVYFIYGTSYMLNVTAEEPGVGAGVLLRAIEPLEGINLMKRLRKTDKLTRFGERAGTACSCIANRPAVGRQLTCAPTVRFGLGLRFERLRTLAQLCASASRVRWTGGCVSLKRAVRSLVVPARR